MRQLLLVFAVVVSVAAPLAGADPPNKTKETSEGAEPQRKPVAELLRSGFVAFSVSLAPENTVGGYFGLNDYVIVYFTKTSDLEKKTTVLMKNIRVLVEPIAYPHTGGRACVVLEVTSEEAKLLKSATEQGTLALGLVAAADLKDEKMRNDRKGDAESPKK